MVQEAGLKFDIQGNVICEINVGAEICGHTFANGSLYVLRGQRTAERRLANRATNPQEETPTAEDIAVVPFASRSLTFDGELFLVQSSRERHDHFVRPAQLEGFSIGSIDVIPATALIASSPDKQSLRRRGFSTSHPAVLPTWK